MASHTHRWRVEEWNTLPILLATKAVIPPSPIIAAHSARNWRSKYIMKPS